MQQSCETFQQFPHNFQFLVKLALKRKKMYKIRIKKITKIVMLMLHVVWNK